MIKNNKGTKQPFINAFLIHQRPYLEKKCIAHLFTQEYGMLPTITHLSKKKRDQLHLFTPLSCQILMQTSMSQLKQIECKATLPPLQGKYLFAGLYINELLYRLCQEGEAYENLYTCYQHSLHQLSKRENLALTVRSFEHRLQIFLGYSPNYTIIDEHDDLWFSFDPELGLKPSISKHSQHYHRDQLQDLANGKLSCPQTQATSKHIFALTIKQILGENSLFITKMLPKSL